MGIPRTYKTEAIILRRSDLGEADRIVTLYTPQLGKIRAVAKGARKTTSRLAGHIELFSRSSLLIARAQSLDIISQGQTLDTFLSVRDDLLRTSCALLATELVDQFNEERSENYPTYKLLADTLLRLAQHSCTDLTVLFFEMQLLRYTGYRPELQHCIDCRTPLKPVTNFFSPGSGGVLCPGCAGKDNLSRSISVNTLKVLRFLQDNEYAEVSRLKLEDRLKLEVESILRGYVKYILDRDLKSTQFLDLLRNQAADRQ